MTNEQKLDALKELLDGATYEDVAKKYSVSKQYIFQIFSPILGKRGEGARIKEVKYEILHDFIKKNYGSVNKFCKKTGIANNSMSDLLKGKNGIKKMYIDKIIKETGLKYEEIFAEDWGE